MPVIFSHDIDVSTMQAGDFKVTTASGKVGDITGVTLAPADDRGELRTALLAGHYGSIDDQPAKVEIVGNLLSIDQSVNFKGMSAGGVTKPSGDEADDVERLRYKVTVLKTDGGEAQVALCSC